MVVLVFTAHAHAAEEVFLGNFENTKTGEKVRLTTPKATAAEIRRDSPKQIDADMRRQCNQGMNVMGIARTFGTEATIFNAAMGIHTVMMAEGDPAALRHFAEMSLTDPVAHVSFGAFMVGNHGAMKFFMQRDWLPDLCAPYRTKGKVKPWVKDPTRYPKPRYSKTFQFLAPSFGMSVGMIASSAIHEAATLFRSPDFQMCSKGFLGKTKNRAESLEACDRAYQTFMDPRKNRNYLPALASLVGVSVLQGGFRAAMHPQWMNWVSVKAQRKGYMKVSQVAVKGFTFMTRAGSYLGGPYAKVAITGINLLSFFILDEMIMNRIMPPWEAAWGYLELNRELGGISTEIARAVKSNWNWTPKTRVCTKRVKGPVRMMARGDLQTYKDVVIPCDYAKIAANESVPALLRQHGETHREFRKIILEKPNMSIENWKDYVLRFQNIHNSSYTFYGWVVDSIAKKKMATDHEKETGESAGITIPLFQDLPGYGTHTTSIGPDGKVVADSDATSKIAVKRTVEYLDRVLAGKTDARVLPWDRSQVREIRDGLKAAIRITKLEGEGVRGSALERKLARFPKSQRASVLEQESKQAYVTAINTIRREAGSAWFSSFKLDQLHHVKSASDLDKYKNPFQAAFVSLGNPNPMPVGFAAIDQFDNNASILDQDLKQQKPNTLAWYKTPRMVDYLLASMVCGPTPGRNALVEEQTLSRATFYPPRLVPQHTSCLPAHVGHSERSIPMSTVYHSIGGSKNLLDYVKQNALAELFTKEGEYQQFDKWWNRVSATHVNRLVRKFEIEFRKIIDHQLVPALIGDEKRLFRPRSSYNGQLYREIARLGGVSVNINEAITKANARDIMLTEMNTYINLATIAHLTALNEKYPQYKIKTSAQAQQWLKEFRAFQGEKEETFKLLQVASSLISIGPVSLEIVRQVRAQRKFTTLDLSKTSARQKEEEIALTYSTVKAEYTASLGRLAKMFSSTAKDNTRRETLSVLLEQMSSLLAETDAHVLVMNNVRLQKLKTLKSYSF